MLNCKYTEKRTKHLFPHEALQQIDRLEQSGPNLNKLLQGRSIQAGVISQEIQLLQLEVVSVVALSLALQDLEDSGSDQQVHEVGQSQKYRPAQFDPDQLEPRHQTGLDTQLMLDLRRRF